MHCSMQQSEGGPQSPKSVFCSSPFPHGDKMHCSMQQGEGGPRQRSCSNSPVRRQQGGPCQRSCSKSPPRTPRPQAVIEVSLSSDGEDSSLDDCASESSNERCSTSSQARSVFSGDKKRQRATNETVEANVDGFSPKSSDPVESTALDETAEFASRTATGFCKLYELINSAAKEATDNEEHNISGASAGGNIERDKVDRILELAEETKADSGNDLHDMDTHLPRDKNVTAESETMPGISSNAEHNATNRNIVKDAVCDLGPTDPSLAAEMVAAWETLPDVDAGISKHILGCNGTARPQERPTSPEPKAKRRPRPRPWLPEPPSILQERLANATRISTAQESLSRQYKVIGAEKMVPAPKKVFLKPNRINGVEAIEIQPIRQKIATIQCVNSAAMDTLDPNVSEKKLHSEASGTMVNRGQESNAGEVDNFIMQDKNDKIPDETEIVIVEEGGVSEAHSVNELEVLVDEFADDDDFGNTELKLNLDDVYSWELLQEAEDRNKKQIQEAQSIENEKNAWKTDAVDELDHEEVDAMESLELPYVIDTEGDDSWFKGENDMEIDSGLEAVGGVECTEVSSDDNEEGDTSTGNDIFFVDAIGDRGVTKTDALNVVARGGNKSYSSVVRNKIRGPATPHKNLASHKAGWQSWRHNWGRR